MESHNFTWELFEDKLPELNDYLSLFLGLKKEFTFHFFMDMERILKLYPIDIFRKFYSFPPFYVKI
jgi:hypothetical protein